MTVICPPAAHVLVAGVSTRAIAESAARAGYQVTSIDAFADLDQHPSVRALTVPGGFSPEVAARAVRDIACDAVAYLSSFENYPGAVAELASGRTLLGNSPQVLAAVRDPHRVFAALSRRGLHAPAVLGDDGASTPGLKTRPTYDKSWLLKPLASGGGHGIAPWRHGAQVPVGHYLQQHIDGTAGSVAFIASPHGVRVLGVFQQLIGQNAFGTSGFRYCGNILDGSMPTDSALLRNATALAHAVAEDFGLIGINGIDFISRDDGLYPVEVNPRWCASVELVERAHGVSAFAAHAQACTAGALPLFDGVTAPPIGRSIGKAVIYAQQEGAVADTTPWCMNPDVRDVPRPHTRFAPGDPVCTVFAEGPTPEACRLGLEQQATRIYRELSAWSGSSR